MPTSKTLARSSPKQRPPVAAVLDLAEPPERAAFDLIQRFCTGRWPLWRLLDLHREGNMLCAAVEWCRSRGPERYAVATLSLQQIAICWRYFPSATAARQALAAGLGAPQVDSLTHPAQPFLYARNSAVNLAALGECLMAGRDTDRDRRVQIHAHALRDLPQLLFALRSQPQCVPIASALIEFCSRLRFTLRPRDVRLTFGQNCLL